jgi:RecA/RadA recombinase
VPPKKKGAPELPASKTAVSEKKKKGENIPSCSERAAALMEDINKKSKGRAILMKASDYRLPYLTKRLPTGLLTLDLALRGGFPAGGISQIIGRRNSGKTLLAWLMIRQLQHFLGDKMRVLLAMTEIPADRSQARNTGVVISLGDGDIAELNKARKLNGREEFTKEEMKELKREIGTIHELHATSVEDFYDVVLRSVEENIYHLIVIDSIGNALSNAEVENASVHDKTYGGTSAPNTTFLKKLTNMLTMPSEWSEVRDTCLIGINQVRDNIKDPNKAYKSPGGNALEHAKLVDLYLESGSQIGSDEKMFVNTNEGPKTSQRFVATGKQVNWKIEKGKAGMHEGERGTYAYDFRINNVDFYTDTLVAGVQHGVVEMAGAWYGIRNPVDPNSYLVRTNGKDAFIKALYDNTIANSQGGTPELSFMNFIRDECFKKLDINIHYDWEM